MTTRRSWGTIRKLPSGRYRAEYTGPDAQIHKAATTFEDRDTAVVWLNRERRLIENDEWTSPEARQQERISAGQTFREYATVWLARRRTKHGPIKDRTRAHYQKLLDGKILPTFGNMALKTITPEAVEAWYGRMELQQTPVITAHAYSLMHAIMASAAARDSHGKALIPFNPCLIPGAQKAPTKHEAEPASVQELAVMIENMAPKYQLAVALMGWCALRFGEVTALERGDIDLRNRVVKITKGVVQINGVRKLDTPKSHEVRSVAYPPHLHDMVLRHLDQHAEPGRNGKLFPSRSGGYLAQSTLNGKEARRRRIKGRMVNESATGFRKACDAAGRTDFRIHDLRHTGLTLAAGFATLAELQARGGHSTASAALRYQHVARNRDAEIAAALSRLLEGE